jgi:aspartate/tyrosine/aromatic aminotransferase
VGSTLDKEYTTIEGDAEFNKGARSVILGFEHPDVTSGRVVSSQTLSGTGALRVLSEFLRKFRNAPIYVSKPTWSNHF